MSSDDWETLSDDFWGDVPRLLCRWETHLLGAFAPHEMLPFPSFFFLLAIIPDLSLLLHFVVKERSELESRFDERGRRQLSTQGRSRISTNSLILVHLLVTI